MNQISNFYKWQNYNGVSENYSNDIQYRFAITDCFGWKAFYFVFFFVPGYNFSLFNRVSNQSLPMFCVFHGIETRPMLLLTPYKSNNMLETICYIDVHRIMCRLKRNFYLRTSDKTIKKRERERKENRKQGNISRISTNSANDKHVSSYQIELGFRTDPIVVNNKEPFPIRSMKQP